MVNSRSISVPALAITPLLSAEEDLGSMWGTAADMRFAERVEVEKILQRAKRKSCGGSPAGSIHYQVPLYGSCRRLTNQQLKSNPAAGFARGVGDGAAG